MRKQRKSKRRLNCKRTGAKKGSQSEKETGLKSWLELVTAVAKAAAALARLFF